MDEATNQIVNQEEVQGQVGVNYGVITNFFGHQGAPTSASTLHERVWNVPHQRNPFFTGREDLLKQLHDYFRRATTADLTQSSAITGLGGIGKTQIAVEYAHRYRDDYHYTFWMRANSRETLINDFLTLAELLGLPKPGKDEDAEAFTTAAVKHWLTRNDKWLLILDNADELDILPEFLPSGSSGHILLTTRGQATGTIAHSIPVDKMGLEEGTLLLLRRSKLLVSEAQLKQAASDSRAIARQIVKKMDGLPLALDQAAAYIEEMSISLKDYLRLYQSQRQELLIRRGRLSSDHPASVVATFLLSFQHIEEMNTTATEFLRLCAWLDPDAIPEAILLGELLELDPLLPANYDNELQAEKLLDSLIQIITYNELRLNDAIDVLKRCSLIQRNPTTKTLSIHRLIQVVLKDMMSLKEQHLWANRAVQAVNRTFPEIEHKTWFQCQLYIPHALACAELINKWNIKTIAAAQLLNQTGYYLQDRARYKEAEPLYRQALAIRQKTSGAEHPGTATSLNNLATLYETQGKYTEAEPLLQQALTIRQKALGTEHPNTANSLNNLGELYEIQGKYAEAEPLYRQALAIREKILGIEHLSTTNSLSNLAILCFTTAKYTEAEPLLQLVLAIRQKVLGTKHPDTAASLNNLAELYRIQGKYTEAEPLLQQALAIRQKVLGTKHPDIIANLNNLATLYETQGKYTEAEPLLQKALAIAQKALGMDHPDTATILNNLAQLYYTLGKYSKAEPLLQQALTITQQVLGVLHHDMVPSLNNLATIYYSLGKYSEAEPLLQQALAIMQRTLGADHPDTAKSLNNLAAVFSEQGKYVEAESLLQKALAIIQKALGAEHPDTAPTLNNLALLDSEQGKYAEAEQLSRQALAITERTLGADHPETATILNNQALIYYKQGKYKQAEQLLKQASVIAEKMQGPNHPDTMVFRKNRTILLKSTKTKKATQSKKIESE